ncbi:MAG: tetratricopeptide repeat protein, partial [Acidobacteriota bacterium]
WAETLLRQRKIAESLRDFDQILATHPAKSDLKRCGISLLAAGQYTEAEKFFSAITDSSASDPEAILDLAITKFHLGGPQTALATLDTTPPAARKGDYYLLRAQILDAEGKAQQAAENLTLGLRNSPTRADLYFQAALFLIQHGKYREVLQVLQQAVDRFPNSRQLLLTQAIAYGIVHQEWKSEKILGQIEGRWPEWGLAYMIHAIILVGLAKTGEAKPLLETAIALGIRSPLAYYDLALADMEGIPPDPESAYQAIQKSLQINPDDPYTQSLAGRIDNARKDYPNALVHLKKAIQLWPDMVEAHEALSASYRAMHQRDKSIAELKEVLRIKQHTQGAKGTSQPTQTGIKQLLFSVPAPRPSGIATEPQGAGTAQSDGDHSNGNERR